MNNAELFKKIFGEYATEIWSKPENEFLKWLNESNAQNTIQRVESVGDVIDRQAAIDALGVEPLAFSEYEEGLHTMWTDAKESIEALPSAQPERLTDDDFETIRIHLNAYKEKLCNQQRWEEAEEYQRIIDRFRAFASVQPEITKKDVEEYCSKR